MNRESVQSGLFPPAVLGSHLVPDEEDEESGSEKIAETVHKDGRIKYKERTEGAKAFVQSNRKTTLPGGYKAPMYSGADTSHRGNEGSSYYVPLGGDADVDFNDLGSGNTFHRFFIGFVQFFRGVQVLSYGCHWQAVLACLPFAILSCLLMIGEAGVLLALFVPAIHKDHQYLVIVGSLSPVVLAMLVLARIILQHALAEFFGNPISRMVERRLTQHQEVLDCRIGGMCSHFLIFHMKTFAWLLVAFFFLLLNIVPLVGTVVGFGCAFGVVAFASAQSAIHCAGRRHATSVFEQFETVVRNGALSLGFGAACLVATAIPILNHIFVPVAIAAGTQMYLQLEYYGRTVNGGNHYSESRVPNVGGNTPQPKPDPRPFSIQIS